MSASNFIPVQLCCNGANGMPDGCGLRAIHIGHDTPLELEAMWWDEGKGDFCGPEFEYHFRSYPDWNRRGWGPMPCRGDFQIMRRRFPFVAWRSHVGNICWDVAIVPISQCVRMLRWLRRKELFSVSSGTTELFDLWESRSQIKPAALSLTL